MDRNNLIGFSLIGLILVAFYFYNKPSQEELDRIQHQRDSIAHVQQEQQRLNSAAESAIYPVQNDSTVSDNESTTANTAELYGDFASVMTGDEEFITLENKYLDIKLSTLGGRVYSVVLKDFLTYDKKPLVLFDGDDSEFGFSFFTQTNRRISTKDIYFKVTENNTLSDGTQKIVLTADLGDGRSISNIYTLAPEDYLVNYSFKVNGVDKILPRSVSNFDLHWQVFMRQNEKGATFETRYSGLYYKYYQNDVEHISGNKSSEETLTTRVKWVGYKDQFFSSVLIADNFFTSANVNLEKLENVEGYLFNMTSDLSIPVSQDINFKYYFGPNNYKILQKTGYELQKVVNLGWPVVSWFNKYVVINVFDILNKHIANYGIIILILTVFIKLIIFPFTFKSYISTAKMRVLKPQIDEINKKIPKDKAMERQQATMALYRKVGVSPMGGCLPMVFQFPILVAMFYFFPASIELRQESFLWAKDLASYDSIFSWQTQIPILSNIYGNHVSLFTLLMAIVNVFYTKINSEMTASTNQMPGMKTMMYMMPVMFLFFFNNYSAGLSYYYFLSTLITVGQTYIMRRFVDEDALLAKLEANKKKPAKKSKFQERLANMQKQQQAQIRQNAKNRKR
ncbi:membrane protein insertase YidC [Saccharicrinis sp. FJH2]|uniref:membrane protein insertase YidC n=1 Tax=Saccharicrinis sp. FJH65 TaxID=3344659 RepID=UPI0035F367BC